MVKEENGETRGCLSSYTEWWCTIDWVVDRDLIDAEDRNGPITP